MRLTPFGTPGPIYGGDPRAMTDEGIKAEDLHKVVQLNLGRLLCYSLRHYLDAMKLAGYDVNWHEGHGWFERTFTINVSQQALGVLECWLKAAMGQQTK